MAAHTCLTCGDPCDCGGYDDCETCSICAEQAVYERGLDDDGYYDDNVDNSDSDSAEILYSYEDYDFTVDDEADVNDHNAPGRVTD